MKKFLWISGGAIFLLLGVWSISMQISLYRFFNPNLDRYLAANTIISSEWIQISTDEPLKLDREVQQVVLYVERPVKPDDGSWGLLLPSGSLVTPEVQIVAEDGETYDMTDPSFFIPSTDEDVQRGFGNHDLPKDKSYRTVRIRCDQPVRVSKVVWRCYDPRDRK